VTVCEAARAEYSAGRRMPWFARIPDVRVRII
jgi:hypothetical protein